MKQTAFVAILLCLSIWLVPQLADALTVYTDRTPFEKISRSFTIETFEGAPVVGTPTSGAVFKQAFPDFKVSAKKPYPAIKVLTETSFGAGNTTPGGSHYLYLDTDRSSQGSIIRICFKSPVYGVGFNYTQLNAQNTSYFATVKGQRFPLAPNPLPFDAVNPLFWGVVSDKPFSRLIINSGVDSGYGLDDLIYLGKAAPVPEPSSLLLLAAGLGALGSFRWWRKARRT
jgi:hypothetical protein